MLALMHKNHQDELCTICGQDFEFELPDQIISAAKSKKLILFLGAGISTESPKVTPSGTFYDQIRTALGDTIPEGASFPEVMAAYEEVNTRKALIEQIYQRFENAKAFRDSYYYSTEFFRELATMPYIDTIFTTNWDTNTEEFCAATPFITGQDIALWDIAERKVLKIHGSISNLGSIIATTSDYETNFESLSRGFMGSFLKTAFATKTVVFIGYSLRDWNILKLYEDLTHDLGGFTPTSFKVSPNATLDSMHSSIKPIATSGTNFLKTLKSRMLQAQYLPDTIYDDAAELLEKTHELDPRNQGDSLDAKQYPLLVYSWAYNDGLRDALDRIIRFKKTGQYSDKSQVFQKIHYYEHLTDNADRKGLFWDEAYLNGYLTGLSVLANISETDEGEPIKAYPLFQYDSEVEIDNLIDLRNYLERTKDVHDEHYQHALQKVKDLPDDFILNHSGDLPSAVFDFSD